MSKNDSLPAAGESFLLVYHARLPVISAFHRWHGRCNTRSKTTIGGLTMKRNTKIALVMMALSAMAMGSTSAFAHGGHGMWQQNAAPLTSEQQTAWQKIHNDFYAQSSALQQQLVTKRYEYNALLAANPPDSSKINAVAKEMENLRQSLDELRVKRDIAMAEAGIPRGTGMGYGGCGGGGHMGMGHW
ncbi:zinc resistance-associated protein [Escherichia coli 53638]|jgi:zinc resistance-associated protein|nr:Zinc resistance-associated protein [Escherichia coli P12b]EDU66408.1 zinc resistance-associated protein [Escherichia coli 53638]